jgi:hypothetical protein
MSSLEQAYQTQLENIQKKTGKSLEELAELIRLSGLSRHSEMRDMLKRELGLGHGDANALVHAVLKSDGERAAQEKGLSFGDVLDEIYTGPKASLRPIHERLMAAIHAFGEFEIAPKKGYVSLRRKKQFAMLGPATKTRFELGLNIKNLPEDARLVVMPPGSMCNFKVNLSDASEVDEELIAWVKQAYDAAG